MISKTSTCNFTQEQLPALLVGMHNECASRHFFTQVVNRQHNHGPGANMMMRPIRRGAVGRNTEGQV